MTALYERATFWRGYYVFWAIWAIFWAIFDIITGGWISYICAGVMVFLLVFNVRLALKTIDTLKENDVHITQ